MVEIRWVLDQGGQAMELLTSIAEFCRLVAQATEGGSGAEGVIVTVGLSLLGAQLAAGDEETIAAVEEAWAGREWVVPREGG